MPGSIALNSVPCDLPFPSFCSQLGAGDRQEQRLLSAAQRTCGDHGYAPVVPAALEIDAADDCTSSAKKQAIGAHSGTNGFPEQEPIPFAAPFRSGTLVALILKRARTGCLTVRGEIDPHHPGDVPESPLTGTAAEPSRVEGGCASGKAQRVRNLIAGPQPPQRSETEAPNHHALAPSDCLYFGFALHFEAVMRLAQPLTQVGNLVVLGLKLRRLSLQFGLDFCELRP